MGKADDEMLAMLDPAQQKRLIGLLDRIRQG